MVMDNNDIEQLVSVARHLGHLSVMFESGYVQKLPAMLRASMEGNWVYHCSLERELRAKIGLNEIPVPEIPTEIEGYFESK